LQNSLPTHCSLWSRGQKSDGGANVNVIARSMWLIAA
jgi:hypothetical protein